MKFRLSTLLLAMAAICFLLPFVNVRCSQEAMNLMNQSVNGADSLKADATPTKGDLVFYYTGIQLVLGQEPTQVDRKTDAPGPNGDSLESDGTEDSIFVAPPAAPVGQTRSTDPFRTVQGAMPAPQDSMQAMPQTLEGDSLSDTLAAEQPAVPMEEPGKPKPNIYALAALVLILAGLFGSIVKGQKGLIVASIASVAAVALLNVMKATFGTYLLATGQIMKEQMQYYEVEFTGMFWLCIALLVLAFIESAIRMLTGWNENRPQPAQYTLMGTEPVSSLYEHESIVVDPEESLDEDLDEDLEELDYDPELEDEAVEPEDNKTKE